MNNKQQSMTRVTHNISIEDLDSVRGGFSWSKVGDGALGGAVEGAKLGGKSGVKGGVWKGALAGGVQGGFSALGAELGNAIFGS